MNKKRLLSLGLTVGAIGVVFGDIGASPLYALQTLFRLGRIPLTADNLYGVVSMIIWAMVIVVTGKYILLITRADNDGEGGILALTGLLRGKLRPRAAAWALGIGFVGLAFFYADSMVTPALSVLAALDGIRVVAPQFAHLVIPTALVVLVGLFWAQSRGSGVIGRWFGPVMVAWFVISGIAGLAQVVAHPAVLIALSPLSGAGFVVQHPMFGFLALTAVTLALTGTEALYADMGQFGRTAIRRAWFFVVFPALALNYMGQAALVAADPSTSHAAYYSLYPELLRIPVIVMATIATITASQAVISGVFSLTRQAVRLGYLPPLLIKHTSSEEVGQIYVGAVNWLMCVVVVILVIAFGRGNDLAGALSLAVSGTWLVDGILFAFVAATVLRWSWMRLGVFVVVFVGIDSLFVASGLGKLWLGGWITVVAALVAMIIVTTWTRGRGIVNRERHTLEGSLDDFVRSLQLRHDLPRPQGSAIYLAHHNDITPLALRATVDHLHELMSTVIIVNVRTLEIPHVPVKARATLNNLGYGNDGISQVTLEFGFNDVPNVPLALEHIRNRTPELRFSPDSATYFISDSDITIMRNHRMSRLQKQLFVWMHRNATKTTTYFRLPADRTIDMASYIEL